LTETEKQIKDSPQPRFQLEIGLVKLAHATRLRALDEVIQQLEALASQLSGGNISALSSAPLPAKSTTPVRANTPPAKLPRVATKEPVAPAPANSLEEPPGFSDSFARASFEEPPAADAPPPIPRPTAKPAPAAAPLAVTRGHEIGSIKMELEKRRKPLIVMALEEAQVEYRDGKLTATFASENTFSKRLKESADLFRDIGEQLLGQPLRVEVRLNGEAVATPVQESRQARETLLESVKSNPAVKLLLETFRGEIVDVQEA
jgi:DNA polymerase III gamma/tau subunit